MTPEGGTWEQWMAALEELDQALPERAHPSCPNCGRRELRAQYIGVPTDRIGYAAIWCDHCHWGAYTGRAEIPAAADMPAGHVERGTRTAVRLGEQLPEPRTARISLAGEWGSAPPWIGWRW